MQQPYHPYLTWLTLLALLIPLTVFTGCAPFKSNDSNLYKIVRDAERG